MKVILASLAIIFSYSNSFAQRILAETSFQAENISRMTINGSFCEVMITSGTVNSVVGIVRGSGDPKEYEFELETEGDELNLRLISSNSWKRIEEASIRVTIKSMDELVIKTSSGELTVDGIDAKTITLTTTSGSLQANNVTANQIMARTTSGELSLRELSGTIQSKSTSGNQVIREIKGELTVGSTSGNISVSYFDAKVICESTSGNISVYNGKGLSFAKTTSGNIEGRDLMLDQALDLKATSGNIRLGLMNDFDMLSFDLESSSGEIDVANNRASNELYVKKGSIWISGKTSSGEIEIYR